MGSCYSSPSKSKVVSINTERKQDLPPIHIIVSPPLEEIALPVTSEDIISPLTDYPSVQYNYNSLPISPSPNNNSLSRYSTHTTSIQYVYETNDSDTDDEIEELKPKPSMVTTATNRQVPIFGPIECRGHKKTYSDVF